MFLRLEVVEEMEEEEKKNINEKTNLKEFLRSVYFKHYKKWSALTICVFLGKIPSRSPLNRKSSFQQLAEFCCCSASGVKTWNWWACCSSQWE